MASRRRRKRGRALLARGDRQHVHPPPPRHGPGVLHGEWRGDLRDLRLIAQAVHHGWPVPPDRAARLVRLLAAVVRSGPRGRALFATRLLVRADRLNVVGAEVP